MFVALSYSFLGGKAKSILDKPFAGAPGAPGGSQPAEQKKDDKPSPPSGDCDPKGDKDGDGKVTPAEKKAAKPAEKNGDKAAPKKDEEDMPPPRYEFGGKDDYQLGQAVTLLKAWQVMKR